MSYSRRHGKIPIKTAIINVFSKIRFPDTICITNDCLSGFISKFIDLKHAITFKYIVRQEHPLWDKNILQIFAI